MAQVYLETSFFSACVTTRTDVQSRFWKRSSLAWFKTQREKHELFISGEVLAELAVQTYPHGQEALEFTVEIPVLDVTEEVLGLARVLVNEKVMPGPQVGDSVHVAVAVYYGMEYVLSWNVKHLANPNKRPHLAKVCLKVGKIPPMIVTPEVLWEPDNE